MFGIDVVKEVVTKQTNQILLGNMTLMAIAEGQCDDLYAKFKYVQICNARRIEYSF